MTTSVNAPGVKLTATGLDPDKNGLIPAAQDMIDNPGRVRVALVVFTTTGVEEDFTKQTITAKAKVTRVETIEGDDLAEAQRLLLRAHDRRAGKDVLPYATEAEIEEVFASFVDDGTFPTDGGGGED